MPPSERDVREEEAHAALEAALAQRTDEDPDAEPRYVMLRLKHARALAAPPAPENPPLVSERDREDAVAQLCRAVASGVRANADMMEADGWESGDVFVMLDAIALLEGKPIELLHDEGCPLRAVEVEEAACQCARLERAYNESLKATPSSVAALKVARSLLGTGWLADQLDTPEKLRDHFVERGRQDAQPAPVTEGMVTVGKEWLLDKREFARDERAKWVGEPLPEQGNPDQQMAYWRGYDDALGAVLARHHKLAALSRATEGP